MVVSTSNEASPIFHLESLRSEARYIGTQESALTWSRAGRRSGLILEIPNFEIPNFEIFETQDFERHGRFHRTMLFRYVGRSPIECKTGFHLCLAHQKL